MIDKKSQRLNEILNVLKRRNGASIKELSRELDVSHMTVRRDLGMLEEQGLVTLFHGGAVYNQRDNPTDADSEYSLVSAESEHVSEKRRIGRAAADLIEPGDILIIDTGSTTEAVARELPVDTPLTILCYSMNVLQEVTRHPQIDLIFAGGNFHPNTLMFESPEGISLIERNRAEKAFISAAGVSLRLGVTCLNSYERDTKVAAIRSSLSRILVADSSKFGKIQPSYFADVGDFDVVVTDEGIPEEYADEFRERGIRVVIA
jgi:DeoR family deoxyribose operon repressor